MKLLFVIGLIVVFIQHDDLVINLTISLVGIVLMMISIKHLNKQK